MNRSKFETEVIPNMLKICENIRLTKGKDYQSTKEEGSDVLANFKRTSDMTGINKETALFIFMTKHYDSISTFIKDLQKGKEYKGSEPIELRLADIINYCLLLYGMIIEDGENKPPIQVKKSQSSTTKVDSVSNVTDDIKL